MAMRCSSSPLNFMIIPKRVHPKKPFSRLLMFTKPQARHQTPLLQINSSFNNIVFEDPCNGIICHTDENGDMICEGYDEGPRLNHQQLARLACNPCGDTKIIDMLQRSWFKVADKESLAAAQYSTPVDSP
ncbi:Chromodomain-helicase-DNA-binding protein like [Heracleum sosnowskyi]|uniref:Chromodomain-helicase-DNA-binding protein like n=1 Tax=Heracleum sosnowskyi TaxID=360622 RepID=A0AAD8MH86_9APIA|nr:Chromodomain-helicase-DNA-binding protein like [Heracleum sosnowskyi]